MAGAREFFLATPYSHADTTLEFVQLIAPTLGMISASWGLSLDLLLLVTALC